MLIRYIRVGAERQARAEAMKVDRNRQVKADQQDVGSEAAQTEAERRAATMKLERQATDVE